MKEKLKSPLWLINVNIGYLRPAQTWTRWFFDDLSQIDDISNEQIDNIKEFGYPFYSEYEDIERMINVYETRVFRVFGGMEVKIITKTQQFTTLPLLYQVIGERNKGIDFMNDMIQKGYPLYGFTQIFYDNFCSMDQ